MLWQVQEAKQRFSELLRAVQSDGPQIVTRHGEEIAVVIDIADFHRLRGDVADFKDALLGGPKFADDVADIFAAIEAERKADLGRAVDFEGRPVITCLTRTSCRRHANESPRRAWPTGSRQRRPPGCTSPC